MKLPNKSSPVKENANEKHINKVLEYTSNFYSVIFSKRLFIQFVISRKYRVDFFLVTKAVIVHYGNVLKWDSAVVREWNKYNAMEALILMEASLLLAYLTFVAQLIIMAPKINSLYVLWQNSWLALWKVLKNGVNFIDDAIRMVALSFQLKWSEKMVADYLKSERTFLLIHHCSSLLSVYSCD